MNHKRGNASLTAVVKTCHTTTSVPAEAMAKALEDFYEDERRSVFDHLANLERVLGYGTKDKPTTAQVREWWRTRGKDCPVCGGK